MCAARAYMVKCLRTNQSAQRRTGNGRRNEGEEPNVKGRGCCVQPAGREAGCCGGEGVKVTRGEATNGAVAGMGRECDGQDRTGGMVSVRWHGCLAWSGLDPV